MIDVGSEPPSGRKKPLGCFQAPRRRSKVTSGDTAGNFCTPSLQLTKE